MWFAVVTNTAAVLDHIGFGNCKTFHLQASGTSVACQ